MSTTLLRQYIAEVVMSQEQGAMNQNIVRKDPEGSGHLVIRKLVTYEKPASRFAPGEDVDTELQPDGSVKVDDLETWKPNFEKVRRRAVRTVRARRERTRRA